MRKTLKPSTRAVLHAACLATFITLVGKPSAAQAAADYTIAVPSCSPGNAATATATLGFASPSGGFVRAGRNPPRLYFCPVWNPDDVLANPGWRQLRLQFKDPNTLAGNVQARLWRKSRFNGATRLIGTALSKTSAAVTVVSVPLSEALDFSRYGYYIVVDLASPPGGVEVEAHMVLLTQ